MKTLLAFLFLFLLALSGLTLALAADDCRVAWTPNPPKDQVAEYRVYARPTGQLAWGPYRGATKTTALTCSQFGKPIEYRGSWDFVVTAINMKGLEGAASTVVQKAWAAPVKLPAPEILAPAAFAEVDPGQVEIRFGLVAGAAQYVVNVHEEGTPYECERYAFCGNVSTGPVRVPVKAGKKYDMWLFAVDAAGAPGNSRGSTFVVKSGVPTPPPPPPTDTDGDTVPDAQDQCPTVPGPAPTGCPPPDPPPPGKAFKNLRQGTYTDRKGTTHDAIIFDRDACETTRRLMTGPKTETIFCAD